MRSTRDNKCRAVARRQFGLITRAQAMSLGMTPAAIKHRLATGAWRIVHPGIYVIGGTPDGWAQSQLAACFWSQGVAAANAAGVLWRLRGCSERPRPEVLIAGPKSVPRAGIVVHHTTRLLPHHRTVVRAIPCTTIERTLFDLAGTRRELDAAIAIDDALRRRLTSLPALDRCVGELARRGRNGSAVMRRLIEIRQGLAAVPESPLETEFLQLIARSGLPVPTPQFEVRDRGRFIARVDFAYPEQRLAIELDSYSFHSDQASWEKDRDRLSALSSIAWRVKGVRRHQMAAAPQQVVAEIAELLGQPL